MSYIGNGNPSKAQELFYFLKKLADSNGVINMEEARIAFSRTNPDLIANGTAFYSGLKKLEEHGAIKGLKGASSQRIAQLKLLKEEISIPQGKRGRKPGVKYPRREALPPASTVATPEPVVTPPTAPAPVMAAVAPVIKPAAPPPQPEASRGAVVFIDENQIIATLKAGLHFNLEAILEKVVQKLGCEKIERVFIYCSEATEVKAQTVIHGLSRLDNPLVRFVKTGSQPGVVDRRIKEDMELWSRVNFISTMVLATADGGPDFLQAITCVKKAGKKLALLKAAGSFTASLLKLADLVIDGSPPNQHQPLTEIVVEATYGYFDPTKPNSRFVLAVTRCVVNFLRPRQNGTRFMEIEQYVHDHIRYQREFCHYSQQDVRDTLTTLNQKSGLLSCRNEGGKNIYYLSPGPSTLLNIVERFAPMSLSA